MALSWIAFGSFDTQSSFKSAYLANFKQLVKLKSFVIIDSKDFSSLT